MDGTSGPEFTLQRGLLDGFTLWTAEEDGTLCTLRLKISNDDTAPSILVGFVALSGFGQGDVCRVDFPLQLELKPCAEGDGEGEASSVLLPLDQVVGADVISGQGGVIMLNTTMGQMQFRADSYEVAFECKVALTSCLGAVGAWRVHTIGGTFEHNVSNYHRLYSALIRDDVDAVQRFMVIGCPADIMLDEAGETPLMIACRGNKHRMIKLLLSAGASVKPDGMGNGALFISVASGHLEATAAIVRWSRSYGDEHLPTLLAECDQHGSSIFHAAAKNGDVGMMKLLSATIADSAVEELVLQLDQTGRSVLHVAAGEGKLPLLKYLLTSGSLVAHINHTDTNGDTCLDLADGLADETNREKVVGLLGSIGATRGIDLDRSSNAVDSSFGTAVNRAADAVNLCSTSTQTSPERIQSTAKSKGATGRVLVLSDVHNQKGMPISDPNSRALSKPSSKPPPLSSSPSLLATKKRTAPPLGLANLHAMLVAKKEQIMPKPPSSSPTNLAATLSDHDLAPYSETFNERGQNFGSMIASVSKMQADGISELRIAAFKSACNEIIAKQKPKEKEETKSGSSSDRKGALARMLSGIKDNDLKSSLKPASSTPSSSARSGNSALAAMLSARAPLCTGAPTSSTAAAKTITAPVSENQRRASKPLQRTHIREGDGNAAKSVYCIQISTTGTETDDVGSISNHLINHSSVQLLEVHFERKTTTQLKKTPKSTSEQKQGSSHLSASITDKILDPKRSYTMQIALTRFKRLGPHKEVIRIVVTLDLVKVTPSDLEILTQTFVKKCGITVKTLLPSEDEIQRALAYDGDIEALAPAEMWVVEVVKADPKFEDFAKVALTILTFADDVKDLEASLGKLIAACVAIRSSVGLQKLLRGTLEVASVLNESYSQPKKSIAMDSIIPLLKKKGLDGKTSLLDILTNQEDMAANESSSDTMVDFFDGPLRGSVEDASKISFVETKKQVAELISKADKAKEMIDYMKEKEGRDAELFVKRCTTFVDGAEKRVESLSSLMAKGQEEATNLIEWFAEDASRDTSDVFQFVIELAALTKASKEKWLRKNRRSRTTKPFSVKVAAKPR